MVCLFASWDKSPSKVKETQNHSDQATIAIAITRAAATTMVGDEPSPISSPLLSGSMIVDDAKRKGDFLLVQSAGENQTHPSKRPRPAQLTVCDAEEQAEPYATHRPRNKPKQRTHGAKAVTFDTERNKTVAVPSHRDYTMEEHSSYYFQRADYSNIRREIQRTIDFVRSSETSSCDGAACRDDQARATDEHCVRGLESLVEGFVKEHKKKVMKASRSAVFRFQKRQRRKRQRRQLRERQRDPADAARRDSDGDSDGDHAAAVALALAYRRCTTESEQIARRWGHFDAIDAGIRVPPPPPACPRAGDATGGPPDRSSGESESDSDDSNHGSSVEEPSGGEREPLSLDNDLDALPDLLLLRF